MNRLERIPATTMTAAIFALMRSNAETNQGVIEQPPAAPEEQSFRVFQNGDML